MEREGPVRIVELTIPKVTILSIEKRDCENYLFEDYPLKACIGRQIFGITLSERSPQEKKVATLPVERVIDIKCIVDERRAYGRLSSDNEIELLSPFTARLRLN